MKFAVDPVLPERLTHQPAFAGLSSARTIRHEEHDPSIMIAPLPLVDAVEPKFGGRGTAWSIGYCTPTLPCGRIRRASGYLTAHRGMPPTDLDLGVRLGLPCTAQTWPPKLSFASTVVVRKASTMRRTPLR